MPKYGEILKIFIYFFVGGGAQIHFEPQYLYLFILGVSNKVANQKSAS